MISVEHMQELIDRFNSGELDIRDIIEQSYFGGRADAIDEYRNKLSKEMHDLWRFYKADTNNRPKPTFLCANSIVDLIAEQLKEQKNE